METADEVKQLGDGQQTGGEVAKADALDPSFLDQFAGAGNDNVTDSDLQTQFFNIIESNSPFLDKTDGKHIKGAESGMIVNTVTRKIFDGEAGILVVPCYFSKECVEWTPERKIVGRHSLESEEYLTAVRENKKNPAGKLINDIGNEMTETASHALLLVDRQTGDTTRIVVSMTSTKLKKSKRLNTLIKEQKLPSGLAAPRYAQVYLLTVVPEKNNKGKFFNWEPKFAGLVPSKSVFDKALRYHQDVAKAGTPAPPDETDTADRGDGGDPDNVPF